MQKDTTLVSFLSMSIAYSIGLLFFTVVENLVHGKVDDFGVIIFWSAIFEFLAWLVFLIYPLKKLSPRSKIFHPFLFPIISTVYSEIVFIIMIGWGFLLSGDYIIFLVPAIVGYSFGLIYINLINNKRINNFLRKSELNRLVILNPLLFLFLFLYIFPKILPSTAYTFMPDGIQENIVERIIPKFKEGDSFKELDKSLPGYFNHIQNGNGNMSAQMENFSFVIQIENNKIVRLEHSQQKNPDFTIYSSNN